MTVDEAKTKVCPFTLQADINLPLIRQAEVFICNNLGGYCIAGDCMAWKWYDTHENIQTNGYCQRLDPITI